MAMFNFDFSGEGEAKKEYYRLQGELAASRQAEINTKIAAEQRRMRGEYTEDERVEMKARENEAQAKYNTSLAALDESTTKAGQLDFDIRKYDSPDEKELRQAEVRVKLADSQMKEAQARKAGMESAQLEDTFNEFRYYRDVMKSFAGERAAIQGKMAALQTFSNEFDPMQVNVEMSKHQADLDAIAEQEKLVKNRLLIGGIAGDRNEAAINALVANAYGLDPSFFAKGSSRGGSGSEAKEDMFEYTKEVGGGTTGEPKQMIKFKAPLSELPRYDFTENTGNLSVAQMLPQNFSGMSAEQAASAANPFMIPYTGVNPASTGNDPVSSGQLFGQPTQPVQPTQPTKRWVFDPQSNKLVPQ